MEPKTAEEVISSLPGVKPPTMAEIASVARQLVEADPAVEPRVES